MQRVAWRLTLRHGRMGLATSRGAAPGAAGVPPGAAGGGPVQRLADACAAALDGRVGEAPPPASVAAVVEALGMVRAHDVGLAGGEAVDVSRRSGGRAAPAGAVAYLHVHDCAAYSVGVFVLPAGASLPLHDHPGMTVASHLLYGDLAMRAFDWVDHDASGGDGRGTRSTGGAARLVRDANVSAPTEPLVLLPRQDGNIHAFTASTNCAIIDVLAPPYAIGRGRDCTYFREDPLPKGAEGDALLVAIPQPADFHCISVPYHGERVVGK